MPASIITATNSRVMLLCLMADATMFLRSFFTFALLHSFRY